MLRSASMEMYGFGFDHALDHLDPLDAPLQVPWVGKVVEGDGGVVVRVGGAELEMTRGERADYLLEDETAAE
ncbi:hypothetical protein ACMD2_14344 [Ananas comosus]|uniref:Uncharacterized protein n=1 Tax=Ananas comosus TaxID=4615 RepID=A0A199UI44_ANACO|nr:hypothetical protein ACMD2_14344 [Ananas comosus]